MTDLKDQQREDAILKIARNPRLAHAVLFRHRHPQASPDCHGDLIDLAHGPDQHALFMAFRGLGKSTLAEEAITLLSNMRRFRNCLIVGENLQRATDRLRSIKHELETNPYLEELFENQVGPTWQEAKIVLTNGVVIQAHGQGQSLRGTKHLDARPDFLFIDDLESADTVATPDARKKLSDWFYSELLPALEPGARVRMAATPLDPDALAVKLSRSPDWKTLVIPIETLDQDAKPLASWPARFPLDFCQKKKTELYREGKTAIWEQEYMCRAVDPTSRIFTQDMFRCEPQVRTWHPTYAIYDPARTTNKNSASTGRIVASWVQNRLVIWEASAPMWKPDEIIQDMFEVDDKYQPIAIGVEEDGLHEFIMQPLRHSQVQRGHLLPIRPLKAPKGKLDFIRSTQPFFKAREVLFAGERSSFEDAIAQFLSFPTGRIDVPNALAYMMVVRPGLPIYDGFTHLNIVEDLRAYARSPLYLAINATEQVTCAILLELHQGAVHILADCVRDGDAGTSLSEILQELRVVAGRQFTIFAPKSHFTAYDTAGLKAAARKQPVELRRGGELHEGREQLRSLMTRLVRGQIAFKVSTQATWTLRALSGGYARPHNKDRVDDGAYKVLIEGLEAFAATLAYTANESDGMDVTYATTPDGRRYISAKQ